VLLPVLLHKLVKMMTSNFFHKMHQHGYQLHHHYFFGQIDRIVDEHKAFIQAYQHEPVLKQGINAFTRKSSFVEGCNLLRAHFPNLIDYCGIVTILIFRTSTIKSDFLCYARRRMSFVRCYPISTLREFCRRNHICLLNNFLSPISKTCPRYLLPKLIFPNEL
jgi:hypothetical protein